MGERGRRAIPYGRVHVRVVILPDEKLSGAAFDGMERFVKSP